MPESWIHDGFFSESKNVISRERKSQETFLEMQNALATTLEKNAAVLMVGLS